jgi:leucyl aminopeptidase
MDVSAVAQSPVSLSADAIAVGRFSGETPSLAVVAALVERGEARDRAEHVAVTHLDDGRPLIVAGLGPREQCTGDRAMRVAAAVASRAAELGIRHLAWELPHDASSELAEALVLGTVLSAYRFTRFRETPTDPTDPTDSAVSLDVLTITADDADIEAARHAVDRAAVLAGAQNRARDLGNTPPNVLTPTALAQYALALADSDDAVSCAVLDEAEIRDRGMGALAAVAQGSAQPAQLITLRYEGPVAVDAPDAPCLALIGKAVTFDSGGLNLKPGASMIGMKFDMCGGAAVIETVAALAQLRAPVRVLAVVGATENMTGPAAMRPGDVLTAYDGTTIEMNNADAEGRLVLADCITHARREGADAIVDVATLTGGVVTALGSVYAGLMANDDALADALIASGTRTGELLWRLPLHPAYAKMMQGRVAQLTNLSEPSRQASAITAAEFLHHFAGDVPWAHLDIAGVADDVKRPYYDKGATGFGVRLLTELALGFSGAAGPSY